MREPICQSCFGNVWGPKSLSKWSTRVTFCALLAGSHAAVILGWRQSWRKLVRRWNGRAGTLNLTKLRSHFFLICPALCEIEPTRWCPSSLNLRFFGASVPKLNGTFLKFGNRSMRNKEESRALGRIGSADLLIVLQSAKPTPDRLRLRTPRRLVPSQ
jgi:hypothetical protein